MTASRLVRSGQYDHCLDLTAPANLGAVARHAAGCARCGDLLRLFAETELRVRDLLTARNEEERFPGVRVFPLWMVMPAPPRSPGVETHDGGYRLAADGPDAGAAHVRELPVLTLSSEDGRLLVRIFPDESGRGATAVLVGALPRGEEQAGGAKPAARRPFLRLGGVEYAFDERGTAALPNFPASGVTLLLK